jgi:hypothetical protein
MRMNRSRASESGTLTHATLNRLSRSCFDPAPTPLACVYTRVLASGLPAWRGSRIDPADVLRQS